MKPLACGFVILVATAFASFSITAEAMTDLPDWTVISGTYEFVAGDVNGDGYSDIITFDVYYNKNTGVAEKSIIKVYYGSAAGLSNSQDGTIESQGEIYSIASAGDINADGCSDIIIRSVGNIVHLHYGSVEGLNVESNWTSFGNSVSTAADVNGDGYSDIMIEVVLYNSSGQSQVSILKVYYGSAAGLSMTPDWTHDANLPMNAVTLLVATGGDLNNDGYSDIIVPEYSSGSDNTYIAYYGSSLGLSETAAWKFDSPTEARSIASAGDVNGDGYSDFIIGGGYRGGYVFVYYSSPSGLNNTADWQVNYQVNGDYSTDVNSVALAGDVNNDGYSDIIVSWDRNEKVDTEYESPVSYSYLSVYYGSATGLSSTAHWTVEYDYGGDFQFTGSAGDVNGDGYSDVIYTARSTFYVYYGPLPAVSVDYSDGGSSGGGGGGGCFIATAAYGSILEPHVMILREFRDRFLLNNNIGKALINVYSTCSPPIANIVADHESLRFAVRWGLLPIVGLSWVLLNFGPLNTLIFMFLLSSGLIVYTWFRRKV